MPPLRNAGSKVGVNTFMSATGPTGVCIRDPEHRGYETRRSGETVLAQVMVVLANSRSDPFIPQVIVPDKWKAGARNTTEGGGRKLNQNKLLTKKK